MRFCGLALHDAVPGAKTIWLYREQLTKAGAIEGLFARRRGARAASYPAMGGPIVDATAAERRRPRLSAAEKATVKGGHVPEHWSKAKRFRWTRAAAGRSSPGGGATLAKAHRCGVPR
jgi:transposase, IS5 family